MSHNARTKQTKKISCGVVCYRSVPAGKRQRGEFVVVKKRITYAFSAFVNGLYNSNDKDALMRLFNSMTVDEKILILTCDFGIIWRHVWMNCDPSRSFIQSRRRFEDDFIGDRGERLKRMIWATTTSGQLRWEIPKGRKTFPDEMDLQCAVREFGEETGISKENYSIYPSLKRKELYADAGKLYETIYFGAIARGNVRPVISARNCDQMSEICDIRWVTLEELRILDAPSFEKIARVVRPLISALKKRSKK